MQQVSLIIVGNGDRANCYCKYALVHPEELKIAAIVDPSERKRKEGAEKYGVPQDRCFESVEKCIEYHDKNGKIADAVFNGTMDELHYETAIPFLKKGYHMLLEKPVVNNIEQLLDIQKTAEENGCLLMVCHVLRYTPFFRAIKELILQGEIGEIVHIESSENVGVAHSSNSYIRGKWNSTEKCGSSMLLAKCCHDLDLLCWLNGETSPTRIASFGGRNFIVPEKAPAGAGEKCLVDCPHVDTCQYSAKSIYVKNDKFPWYSWDCIDKHYNDISREEKTESLKTFNKHGECAYKTGSDLVDHQTVMLQFKNGSTATHNLLQGTVLARRLIRIVGTKGEIEGSIDNSRFTVYRYDFDTAWCKSEDVDVRKLIAEGDHHAGGDFGIIQDFVNMLRGGEVSVSCTKIQDSVYGHLCVYKADESMQDLTEKDIRI
ncbi:MAG: Gfo/Idh/MocA family oxidoreductase [Clostridia bacterium]|nr:Gfo/Idh/MocA family oxidoreductase [Clostridia bacterium]